MRRLVVCVVVAISTCGASLVGSGLRDGDIIFHTSRSTQSVAIQRATGSRYSHMGLIVFLNGKPHVLEAVATVRYTRLDRWIARGEGGHYVVKRLKDSGSLLTKDGIDKIRVAAHRLEGKPYDSFFEWSDDRIYCSELVWKVYDRGLGVRIGELQRLGDFHLSDPVVRRKLRERYGRQVPEQESVISPSSIFRSPQLVIVVER